MDIEDCLAILFRKNCTAFKQMNFDYLKVIIENTFNEPCVMYIDIIDEDRKSIEFHFSDSNYYEIEITSYETLKSIEEKIISDLINERIIDKNTVGVNRNNVRYFKKYDL